MLSAGAGNPTQNSVHVSCTLQLLQKEVYFMQEIPYQLLYRGRTIEDKTHKSEWILGNLHIQRTYIGLTKDIRTEYRIQPVDYTQAFAPYVKPETICAYCDMTDINDRPICEHDIVKFFGFVGEVLYQHGCFGIAFRDTIDWDYIAQQILHITGCNNSLYACQNDNFVSLWEIYWNFNESENKLTTVQVIGNAIDHAKLLLK